MKLLRRAWKDARGQMLVMGALFFPVVLGAAGMAVDTAFVLHTRTELQKDADAMALAGAQSVCGPTGYASCESSASTAATAVGTSNGVTVSDTVATQFNTSCKGAANSNHDMVTVTITRIRPTFFVRVLGINSGSITACATAQKSALVGNLDGTGLSRLEDTCITGITYGSQVTMKYDSNAGSSAANCTSARETSVRLISVEMARTVTVTQSRTAWTRHSAEIPRRVARARITPPQPRRET